MEVRGPLWIYGEDWWEDQDALWAFEAEGFVWWWLTKEGTAWALRTPV